MFEASVKTVEPMTVAFLAMRGSYSQIPEGFGRLYGWIASRGLTPQGMPMGIYLTDPAVTPEEEAVWELWAPVAGPAEDSGPDDDGLGIRNVPASTVASAMHKGPYSTIEPTYVALMEWVESNGHTVVGAPMEVYYSEPSVPPEEILTEVRFPVLG